MLRRLSNSGSLAMLTAMRRASSLVSVIKPTCCPVGLTQINAHTARQGTLSWGASLRS